MGLVRPSPDLYLKHRNLEKLRGLRLRVIGYRTIEVIAQVSK